MTNFAMTLDEATDVIRLVYKIRRRLGHQHTWDKPGIEAALAKARDMADSPDLACAMIRAAKVPANRTPAIILLDGPHWRPATETTRPKAPPVPVTHRCSVCDNTQDVCESRWAGDHTYMHRALRTVTVKAPEVIDPTRPEHQTVQTLKDVARTGQTGDQVTPPTVDGNPATD